jgi:hypothetical protein
LLEIGAVLGADDDAAAVARLKHASEAEFAWDIGALDGGGIEEQLKCQLDFLASYSEKVDTTGSRTHFGRLPVLGQSHLEDLSLRSDKRVAAEYSRMLMRTSSRRSPIDPGQFDVVRHLGRPPDQVKLEIPDVLLQHQHAKSALKASEPPRCLCRMSQPAKAEHNSVD